MLRNIVNGTTMACGYVIVVLLIGMMCWLIGIFALYWGKIATRWTIGQLLCLFGYTHRNPEVHLPGWDEKAVRVRRYGPLKDHWWSIERYYASVEYQCCRHKGCKAFRITRIFKDV